MSELIHLLTGNEDKLRVARAAFSEFDITVEPYNFDMPEIQAESSLDIARFAVQAAHKATGMALLREDHSFYINELGIPGPYMAYMDKRVSVPQLLAIVDTLPSRKAHFELAASFINEEGQLFESAYCVPVEITDTPSDNERLRWERVMRFPGETQTFADMDSSRDNIWSLNYQNIARQIIASATS